MEEHTDLSYTLGGPVVIWYAHSSKAEKLLKEVCPKEFTRSGRFPHVMIESRRFHDVRRAAEKVNLTYHERDDEQ